MKRILALINTLFFAAVIFAQQPFDYLIRAKAFIETGRSGEAINLLTGALLKIQDYRFCNTRAEAYMSEGDYINAAADFRSANTIEMNSGEYGLARIYALKGDAVNSLNHLEKNINSSFKKSEKEILLDAAFSLIENTPDWRQFWKKERYNVFETKIPEIEYFISTGNMSDATLLLNELKSENSEDPDTKYAEALVALAQQKYGVSVTIMTSLLESDRKQEKYLRLLAKAQISSGNPSGASQSYSDLINMGIPDAELFMLRAECFNKTGETDRALKDVMRYLELYPENRRAISEAGKLESKSGDNLKALEYFSKNIKLHPGDPGCYIDRGNSYFVSGTWDYAGKDYGMALDIQPLNSEAWLSKGITLLNIGNKDDACHDFRAALNLGNKKATGYLSKYCIK
jgi:Flp pilus assembly protein TadD